MKKLTLNQKEYDYLLANNLNFLKDKKVVINNDSKNIAIQKTKRFLIGDKITDYKFLTYVS